MRVPIKQLEQYGDKYGFTDAAKRFASAIIRHSKGYYQTLLINFHHINSEIGKTRPKGSYVRGTLCNVRRDIFNSPSFKVVRRHSPYVYEVQVLPLNSQKNVEIPENLTATDVVADPPNPDTDTDFSIEAEDNGIDQQQLIETNQVCLAVGIKYKKEDLPIIASFGIDAVKQAVNYFKKARLTSTIRNPAGWLRCCLRRKYYLDDIPEFSPINKLIEQINFVLDEYGTLPSEIFNLISSKPPNDSSLFTKKSGISSVN